VPMRCKTSFTGVLLAFFWLLLATTGPANSAGPSIVVDVKSGSVLEHSQAFQRWYPASLTKLMTAYVVFRQVQTGKLTMQSPVTMSAIAAKEPPSKMYYKPGSQLSLDNAMKIILVKSANDVSVAIAESVAGSHERFVQMMNAEAKRLGMLDSRFVNANGLPGKGQRTTARDMAVLGLALRRDFPQYAHYFAIEAISTGKKTYSNYNILIGCFAGANGMKTGFICASGFNQVSSATRNGRTVVSVVFGAASQEERAEESARLLNKGLTTGTLAKPSLYSMRPYGDKRSRIADISSSICTPAARKKRYEGRDVEGKMVLNSNYINSMKRQAKAVRVGLSGRIPAALTRGNIPVPRPRPDQIESAGSPVAASAFKPTFDVPVPISRPSL